MRRCLFTLAIFAMVPSTLIPQVQNFVPVTQEMLLNPNAEDWLMFSRTYDAQRFSPLRQITKQNVNQLTLAWSRHLGGPGQTETIPTVYRGVMYVNAPGPIVDAIDATNGDPTRAYKR